MGMKKRPAQESSSGHQHRGRKPQSPVPSQKGEGALVADRCDLIYRHAHDSENPKGDHHGAPTSVALHRSEGNGPNRARQPTRSGRSPSRQPIIQPLVHVGSAVLRGPRGESLPGCEGTHGTDAPAQSAREIRIGRIGRPVYRRRSMMTNRSWSDFMTSARSCPREIRIHAPMNAVSRI